MCFNDHALINATNTKGETKETCVANACPTGTKVHLNNNGVKFCVPCKMTNCNSCVDLKTLETNEEG